MKAAMISNVVFDEISGGFSAMNRAMYDQLAKEYDVTYIGPVNPRPSVAQRLVSKTRRMAHLGGNFYFFSRDRLDRIRDCVESRLAGCSVDFCVFHGFTPWIHTNTRVPFIAWSDCTFSQYMRVFHREADFRPSDLERIRVAEASWLQKAEKVLFRNRWAAQEAIEEYQLDPSRVAVVGNYGFAEPPKEDVYSGQMDFLMVTTNFIQKGGAVVLEAFREVSQDHPDARLLIIGDHPGGAALQIPNVVYLGRIDKSNADQRDAYNRWLAGARCLVHPTRSDTNPMVIIEAGYFGCPAISTKRYAIPELVKDGISGILLQDEADVQALAKAMHWMLTEEGRYKSMREESRRHILSNYSKEAFSRRVSGEIARALVPRAGDEQGGFSVSGGEFLIPK